MNTLKYWREKNNLTQNELAEQAGVSLRTIQRIEAGASLKGFTLKAIQQALEVSREQLMGEENINIERARRINLSALAGLIIPFGEIIFPGFLTFKTKDFFNQQLGKKIVEIQIIVAVFQSVFLITMPFIQYEFSIRKPLFIYGLLLFLMIKVLIVIINGISLNKTHQLKIALKTSFL